MTTNIVFVQKLADTVGSYRLTLGTPTNMHLQHLRISTLLCLLTAKLLQIQSEPHPEVGWLIQIRTRIRPVYTNAVKFNPDSNPD